MKIPLKLSDFIKNISSETGLNEFLLVGGNVIDFFFKKNFNYNDIDLLIKAESSNERNKIFKKLDKKGFSLSKERVYILRKKEKVYLLKAKKGKINLDIAFCHDPEKVPGPFDVESIYCNYPEMILVDKFSSLKAIKKKKFTLLKGRGFGDENQYILLGRFLVLCSKYDSSLLFPKEHKDFIRDFNNKKKINSEKDFNTQRKSSVLSKILRSILISKDRKGFVKEILRSGILSGLYDPLERSLRILIEKTDLNEFKSKRDFIEAIVSCSFKKDRKKLVEYFNNLNKEFVNRNWYKRS